jgi:hypothetical protein
MVRSQVRISVGHVPVRVDGRRMHIFDSIIDRRGALLPLRGVHRMMSLLMLDVYEQKHAKCEIPMGFIQQMHPHTHTQILYINKHCISRYQNGVPVAGVRLCLVSPSVSFFGCLSVASSYNNGSHIPCGVEDLNDFANGIGKQADACERSGSSASSWGS